MAVPKSTALSSGKLASPKNRLTSKFGTAAGFITSLYLFIRSIPSLQPRTTKPRSGGKSSPEQGNEEGSFLGIAPPLLSSASVSELENPCRECCDGRRGSRWRHARSATCYQSRMHTMNRKCWVSVTPPCAWSRLEQCFSKRGRLN